MKKDYKLVKVDNKADNNVVAKDEENKQTIKQNPVAFDGKVGNNVISNQEQSKEKVVQKLVEHESKGDESLTDKEGEDTEKKDYKLVEVDNKVDSNVVAKNEENKQTIKQTPVASDGKVGNNVISNQEQSKEKVVKKLIGHESNSDESLTDKEGEDAENKDYNLVEVDNKTNNNVVTKNEENKQTIKQHSVASDEKTDDNVVSNQEQSKDKVDQKLVEHESNSDESLTDKEGEDAENKDYNLVEVDNKTNNNVVTKNEENKQTIKQHPIASDEKIDDNVVSNQEQSKDKVDQEMIGYDSNVDDNLGNHDGNGTDNEVVKGNIRIENSDDSPEMNKETVEPKVDHSDNKIDDSVTDKPIQNMEKIDYKEVESKTATENISKDGYKEVESKTATEDISKDGYKVDESINGNLENKNKTDYKVIETNNKDGSTRAGEEIKQTTELKAAVVDETPVAIVNKTNDSVLSKAADNFEKDLIIMYERRKGEVVHKPVERPDKRIISSKEGKKIDIHHTLAEFEKEIHDSVISLNEMRKHASEQLNHETDDNDNATSKREKPNDKFNHSIVSVENMGGDDETELKNESKSVEFDKNNNESVNSTNEINNTKALYRQSEEKVNSSDIAKYTEIKGNIDGNSTSTNKANKINITRELVTSNINTTGNETTIYKDNTTKDYYNTSIIQSQPGKENGTNNAYTNKSNGSSIESEIQKLTKLIERMVNISNADKSPNDNIDANYRRYKTYITDTGHSNTYITDTGHSNKTNATDGSGTNKQYEPYNVLYLKNTSDIVDKNNKSSTYKVEQSPPDELIDDIHQSVIPYAKLKYIILHDSDKVTNKKEMSNENHFFHLLPDIGKVLEIDREKNEYLNLPHTKTFFNVTEHVPPSPNAQVLENQWRKLRDNLKLMNGQLNDQYFGNRSNNQVLNQYFTELESNINMDNNSQSPFESNINMDNNSQSSFQPNDKEKRKKTINETLKFINEMESEVDYLIKKYKKHDAYLRLTQQDEGEEEQHNDKHKYKGDNNVKSDGDNEIRTKSKDVDGKVITYQTFKNQVADAIHFLKQKQKKKHHASQRGRLKHKHKKRKRGKFKIFKELINGKHNHGNKTKKNNLKKTMKEMSKSVAYPSSEKFNENGVINQGEAIGHPITDKNNYDDDVSNQPDMFDHGLLNKNTENADSDTPFDPMRIPLKEDDEYKGKIN